jgi:hypothetical protein
VTNIYRDIEAKRGRNSFDAVRTAMFRGKPCDLRRHFRKNTLLREMVSRADMLAKNDKTGRRFIFETKWASLLADGYSQSAIDRAERICEGSGILTPARCVVRGKEINGWIVIDHDGCRTLIEDGECCQLNITLNSNPPRRKRGQRRWNSGSVLLSPFPNEQSKASSGGRAEGQSPLVSPFHSGASPFQSPLVSPFASPFPKNSESISDPDTVLEDKDLLDRLERKSPPNPVNLERANSINPMKERDQNTNLSPLFLEPKSKPNGQDKNLDLKSLVNELVFLCDGESLFNKKCQRALADALMILSAGDIIARWREFWGALSPSDSLSWRNGADDRFCKTLLEDSVPLVNDPDLEMALGD